MLKKKSLLLLFTAVIAVLLFACAFMLAPQTTAYADTAETHDHSTMTSINSYTDIENGELTAGAYYLGADIEGNITVKGEVTLCLNGHTITGDAGSVITVSENAEFTLCDCVGTGIITGGTGNYKNYYNRSGNWGGGVCVEEYGTFKMLGGTISDNTASCGGGVCVCRRGTFEMSGGEISGNTSEYGGGVYVLGTFEMTGGVISGNTADNGGGVCVHEYGAFEMTDGEISGNTADDGGGVYVGEVNEDGEEEAESLTASNYAVSRSGGFTFEMTGGEIRDNEANYDGGGVYVSFDGTFKMTGGVIGNNTANYDGGGVRAIGAFSVSGAPDITGNKDTADNNNNVCLYGSRKITVTGELTVGAQIGVNNTGAVATGYTQEGKPNDFFIPDDANYCVYISDETSGMVTIGNHNWDSAPWMFNNVLHWRACQNGCGTWNDSGNHNFNQEVVNDICLKSAASCTAKAVYYISCECGQPGTETFENGEALGHDIITHEAKQPTCTEVGWDAYDGCSRCEYAIDKVEIEALGHTLTHHEEVAATEEEAGNKEYWSCNECEKYFSDEAGKTEITDKSSVQLPKLTPPAEQKKSYVWICWLLIPLALAVSGITLGIWLYKKEKAN